MRRVVRDILDLVFFLLVSFIFGSDDDEHKGE